jgi:2,3,4,5-tetrahydropyridine-2-carboxylate N-succinyltransferase
MSTSTRGEVRDAVDRGAQPARQRQGARRRTQADGNWTVNQWLKKAVLLSFRLNPMERFPAARAAAAGGTRCRRNSTAGARRISRAPAFRAVPNCIVRRSAYIAKGVVLMPSFVNLGAYVDEGTMVDTWATVGSCAQIGKNVHLSGGVGIGGVLEPMQAGPTIIEDNCFIGARSEVVEGCIVREGSVLGMGVFIGKSTKIVNRRPARSYGEVPPYSVVVAGTMPSKKPMPNGQPGRASTAPSSSRPSTRRPARRPASTNLLRD